LLEEELGSVDGGLEEAHQGDILIQAEELKEFSGTAVVRETQLVQEANERDFLLATEGAEDGKRDTDAVRADTVLDECADSAFDKNGDRHESDRDSEADH
jgi:hypothetical protein